MATPLSEEIGRIDSCLAAAAGGIGTLGLLPGGEAHLRTAQSLFVRAADLEMADRVTAIFRLEQEVNRAFGAVDRNKEQELAFMYQELCTDLSLNADARRVLETAASGASAAMASCAATLTAVAQLVHRRAFEPRQTTLSAAAVDSRARMSIAERDTLLLRDELSRKRKTQSKEAAMVQSRIDLVKTDLAELYGGANEQYNRVQSDMRGHKDALSSKHTAAAAGMRDGAARLTEELSATAKASAAAESALRKRAQRAVIEAETAAHEFDAELAVKQAALDALREEFARNAAIEADFAAYYSKVDAELLRVKDYHDTHVVARQKAQRKQDIKKWRCAYRIQRWWKRLLLAKTKKPAKEKKSAKGAGKDAKKKTAAKKK